MNNFVSVALSISDRKMPRGICGLLMCARHLLLMRANAQSAVCKHSRVNGLGKSNKKVKKLICIKAHSFSKTKRNC